MQVSVAIVGYQNPADIERCLAALERSTYRNFEIVICENGGADAFDQLSRRLPSSLEGGQRVRIVLAPRNLGYAGGVNVCIRETPYADAWWILNPDTQPDGEAMAVQVGRLAVGDCDAVGTTIYLPGEITQSHGGRWSSWFARAESLGHGSATLQVPEREDIERKQNYLNGASMMISRRFLELTGPMREDYFLYCEEVEWCLRAARRGARLGFASGARVLHTPGTTTGSYEEISRRPRMPIYLNERNKILLTRDLFPGRFPIAALSSLALIFIRFGRRRAWRQVGYGLSGWCAGLLNMRGAPGWSR